MDGFTSIGRARRHAEAPIVVMSARDGVEDIAAALEAGADDYVTNPFVVAEVKARLMATLRRPTVSTDHPARPAEEVALDFVAGPLVFNREAAVEGAARSTYLRPSTDCQDACTSSSGGSSDKQRER